MLTQVSLCRAQPVNQGGSSSYIGNPDSSHSLTAAGEATDAACTQAKFDAGWRLYRIVTDTAVYVKLGSVATAAPRYLVNPGDVFNLVIEKAENIFIAVA